MNEAESFYLNLREGRSWKKPHDDRARAYALKASDASVSSDSTQEDTMESSTLNKLNSHIKAFAATEKQLREQKYKWKQVTLLKSVGNLKRTERRERAQTNMQAYQRGRGHMIRARIAFEALALLTQSNPTSPSGSSNHTEDSNQDSNFSKTNNSSSSSKSSIQSYKTAEHDTDES